MHVNAGRAGHVSMQVMRDDPYESTSSFTFRKFPDSSDHPMCRLDDNSV